MLVKSVLDLPHICSFVAGLFLRSISFPCPSMLSHVPCLLTMFLQHIHRILFPAHDVMDTGFLRCLDIMDKGAINFHTLTLPFRPLL